MNKNKQRAYLWVGLSIIFVLLAIFFALSFANKERQQKVMPIKTTAPKKKSNDWADLSIKQIVGLSIVYTHLKYPDNEAWNDVYDNAQNNKLEVRRFNSYHFDNDRSVEASASQRLYILNGKAALVITNADEASLSTIIMGDDEKQIGSVNLKTAYEYVKDQGQLGFWKALCKNLEVDEQVSTQEPRSENDTDQADNDSNQDSASKSDNSNNKYGLQQFTIPNQFIGKWYSVDKDGKVDTETVTTAGVNGHPLFKMNKKLVNSKEFNNNAKLRDKIWFATMVDGVLSYGVYGTDTQTMKPEGDHMIMGASNVPFKYSPKYYRSLAEAKQHPSKY